MAFIDDLQAEAFRLGFGLVGVTSTNPTESFPIFQDWLDRGMNASMDYLSSKRSLQARAKPELIIKDARSIIMLGMRYLPSHNLSFERKGSSIIGRVASFAWEKDYHLVIPPIIEKLVSWIHNNIPNRSKTQLWRLYTDTGPVLERELAQRAGLGFFGKNSTLINHIHGSYFFIAELFLDTELESIHAPFIDRCGKCTRCIDACPTNSILPNRTIDARRCISFLTIENKSEIPNNLRPHIGQWVFGCDICQSVCPWNIKLVNKNSSMNVLDDFQATNNIAMPNIVEDLFLSSRDFNNRYKHSPIKRAKRGGYLRNIAVAIGNLQLPEMDNYLIKSLRQESDPLIRGHVAWALAKCKTQKSRRELDNAMKREIDDYVRYEILRALEDI